MKKIKSQFWIGKIYGDVLGHKGKSEYIFSSLSKSKKECENMTSFLSGFAAWDVVKIKIVEVKGKK